MEQAVNFVFLNLAALVYYANYPAVYATLITLARN